MAHPQELKRVPSELQKTLSLLASKKNVVDKTDEVAALFNSASFVSSYETCIWWDGCYYCKDGNGDWYCIKCSFF